MIGGGVAGAMAAVAAASEGAQVRLVSRAPGATALYAGGMEIAEGLEQVVEADTHHPFRRLEMNHGEVARLLDEACAELQAALGRAALEIRGSWRRTGHYADIRGCVRPAALVPSSVAPGELGRLAGSRVGVIGIEGVGEYDVDSTVAALNAIEGISAVAVPAALDSLPAGASLSELYGRPAPAPERRAVDVLAFPPGFTDLPENAFELLAAIPSPHGWRLQQALARVLEAAGVEVRQDTVSGFVHSDGELEAAVAGDGSLAADAFVLATGRFIGGGLVKSRLAHEPLLGLGVFHEGRPLEEVYGRQVRFLEYLGPAPAFRTGLLTDPQLRPLAADGKAPYRNLRAAGAVLGGYDYGAGFGFGVPILTGWLAGRWSAG